MPKHISKRGRAELRRAFSASRHLFWVVALFLGFANLLMLTGPLYMVQVYDRVLGSGSVETLVALTLLVAFLYAVMGIVDYARGRIMARIGARLQTLLGPRVFHAALSYAVHSPDPKVPSGPADLETVQRLMSAPVLMAIFDLPWAPIFIFGIFLFHPVLGWLAVVGGAAPVLIAGCHQLQVRSAQSVAARASGNADHLVDQFQQEAAVVRAVGLRPQAFAQWHEMALQGLRGQIEASDVSGGFAALSKALRLFLQSAMLGLGAYLVLQNQMTAGAMIASSILLGRALAPIDMLLGQWSQMQDALKSGRNLAALLEVVPAECARMALPRPAAKIVAKDLHVVPPGTKKASLRGVSFEVRPGQALGVIGSSGSGKSSLAQALTGLWPPAAGTLSLDRAGFAQYGADDLASYVGYLPQRVPLFGGDHCAEHRAARRVSGRVCGDPRGKSGRCA